MIKFPKVHIAASVVNRIMNVRDEIDATAAARAPREPNVPDPTAEGEVIDAKLNAPTPDVGEASADGSNSVAANTLEATIAGGKPIQGVLDGISVG
jgi:hypothetical protein